MNALPSPRIRAANPLPKPKPDKIEPQAPPERPVPPNPLGDPASQPIEIPGKPGGDDVDQPGRGPDEMPPDQIWPAIPRG